MPLLLCGGGDSSSEHIDWVRGRCRSTPAETYRMVPIPNDPFLSSLLLRIYCYDMSLIEDLILMNKWPCDLAADQKARIKRISNIGSLPFVIVIDIRNKTANAFFSFAISNTWCFVLCVLFLWYLYTAIMISGYHFSMVERKWCRFWCVVLDLFSWSSEKQPGYSSKLFLVAEGREQ